MHVNGKKMAVSGLALALTVIAIVLSGILEFNTLFLLGAASFMIGIVIRECGLRLGFAFYLAAILLGMILAPNKLYCITFGAMGFYVTAVEFIWTQLGKAEGKINRRIIFLISKIIIFNMAYIPTLLLFPQLLFAKPIQGTFLLLAAALGQIILFIYDKAYDYFLVSMWGAFRKRIKLDDV